MKKFAIPLLAMIIFAIVTVAGTQIAGYWSPSTTEAPDRIPDKDPTATPPDSSNNPIPPVFPEEDDKIPPKDEDKTIFSWWFKRNNQYKPPEFSSEAKSIVDDKGFYLGNTEEKKVFLTFDEGYENGFTPGILDTLKNNNVKAAFFVTSDFVDKNPELVKRMAAEGHVLGNHTATHPSLPQKNGSEIIFEISDTHIKVHNLTGIEMQFMRPPMGEYNLRVLNEIEKLGYRAVFWSMAYRDWETDKQPGKETAYKHVMDNLHPGAIILLHAVSQSNAEALDDIIKGIKSRGYNFESLNEIE